MKKTNPIQQNKAAHPRSWKAQGAGRAMMCSPGQHIPL